MNEKLTEILAEAAPAVMPPRWTVGVTLKGERGGAPWCVTASVVKDREDYYCDPDIRPTLLALDEVEAAVRELMHKYGSWVVGIDVRQAGPKG